MIAMQVTCCRAMSRMTVLPMMRRLHDAYLLDLSLDSIECSLEPAKLQQEKRFGQLRGFDVLLNFHGSRELFRLEFSFRIPSFVECVH